LNWGRAITAVTMALVIVCHDVWLDCAGKGNGVSRPVTVADDVSDSDDDAIIDEFLPSANQTTIDAALSSALNASEPVSDDESESELAEAARDTTAHQLTPTPDNQSSSHSDDGMLAFCGLLLSCTAPVCVQLLPCSILH